MRSFFSWPIRVHLFVLVMLAVLPALGIIVMTGMERRTEALDNAKQDIRQLTSGMAIEQEHFVNSTRQLIMTLSKIPSVINQDARACEHLLDSLLQLNPDYAAINVATSEGVVFASAPRTAPFSITDRKYFKDIVRTGRFSIGEYIFSRSSGRPVIHFAYPVVDSKKNLRAVVVAAFDVSRFNKHFEIAKLPEGSALALTDSAGVRLYRYPESEKYAGTKDLPEMIEKMTAGDREGSFFAPGIDGKRRLYGFVRMQLGGEKKPYMFIRVGIPERTVLSAANRVLIRNLGFLSVATLLAVILAFILGNQIIARRLDALVETSHQLGQGNLHTRTLLPYEENELGQLSKSIDEMAMRLEERQEESRRAEEALKESEERYRMIFNHSPMGIMHFDSNGIIRNFNDRFAQIMGAPREKIIGFNMLEKLRDQAMMKAVKDALDGQMGHYEGDYLSVTGEKTTSMRAIYQCITAKDGTFLGAVGIFEDITERKRAENALLESEGRYRMLAEKSIAGVYVVWDGKFIFINKNAASYAGYEPEELIGQDAFSIVHPADRDTVRRNAKKMLTGHRRAPYEFQIITKEGQIRWIMETVVPIQYGEKAAILGNSMDITEIKEAVQQIKEQKVMESSILDAISHAVVGLHNRHILFANNAVENIFGWKPEELIGQKTRVLYRSDKDFKEIGHTVSTALKTSKTFSTEYPCRHKDGREIICRINASVIGTHLQEGRIVAIYEDITEHKQAEEAHRKIEAQLLQSQKMEAIGTLASGIAHDFNNILGGIIGYTELTLISHFPLDNRATGYLQEVLRASTRAKDLVQHILAFSRTAEQEKKPLMLAPIVKEVVRFIRASLPTTIEINQTIEETSDVIMADSTQMHQVLMNLCTNAGHAMKNAGGVLEIGLKEVVMDAENLIHHPALKAGCYLELSVRDTGHGISQENIERIFEPYFTTKGKGEGTGLGLAVVHGIVKDHGGEIRVYSEAGKGTIFRVYLPLIEKKAGDGKDMEKAVPQGKGETILFIDDEKIVTDSNKKLLEALGYRVVAETNPLKAIEAFKRNSDAFDIVITDKTMPHLTGFDVAREIRSLRADIPVILCSGIQEKEDMEKLAAFGINRLIIKPIGMSILAEAIRDELDKDKLDIQKA